MQWSCAQTCATVAFTALLSLVGATSYHKAILGKILGGNFTSFVRPVLDDTQTTQVSMRLALYQIRDMDERNQKLIVNVWINLYWHDDFITWDPNSYGNVTTIHVPSSRIWRPDIALYNSVDEERPSTELLSDTAAVVSSKGDVAWSMPVILKSACRVNVANYPFDIQRCPLKFGSWTYNGFELNLTNFADTAILTNFEGNGEWHLVGVPCERHEVIYKCCPEPYPDVTFTVLIKRRPMFYLFHLLFPCVLLTAIGLMTFCLPPESGEKVSLAVTVLLAMTVFMLVIMENIPPTSEVIPLFGQFLGVTILVLAMTTMTTVLVMNAHFRGLRGHRPPAWVRKLFLDWFARFVCMRKMAYVSYDVTLDVVLPVVNAQHGTEPELALMENGKKHSLTSSASSSVAVLANTSPSHISTTWTADNGDHSRCDTNPKVPTDHKQQASQHGNAHSQTPRARSSVDVLGCTVDDGDRSRCNTPPVDPKDPATRKITDLLTEQRAYSSQKTGKVENDVQSDQGLVEWQTVAVVADRVMLVVFTLLVLIAYTVLFGSVPT